MCSEVYTVLGGDDCWCSTWCCWAWLGLGRGGGRSKWLHTHQMLPLWQLNGWGFTRPSSPEKHTDFKRQVASKTAKGDMTGSLQAQPWTGNSAETSSVNLMSKRKGNVLQPLMGGSSMCREKGLDTAVCTPMFPPHIQVTLSSDCCSVTKSFLTLATHSLKHARLPCPSLSPRKWMWRC